MTAEPSTPADLRRMIVGYRLSQAIYVAAKLGIADLLKDGPRSVEDLAVSAKAHGPSLYRIVRLLAGEGVFEELEQGRFGLTPLAERLRSDAPDSLRARAIFDAEEWNWRAWGNLLHSAETGAPAFDHAFGMPTFDYLARNPEAAERFDALMAEQTGTVARAVTDIYDFSGMDSVVDVGGGYGALLAAVLEANPHLRGILVDLPHTVEGAGPRLEQAGVADRCETVAGDFFHSVPAGGSAYFLKYILHDWNDDQCVTILENCRKGMSDGARLLVIEMLVSPGNAPDYGKYLDVNMLVLTTGRERTREEFAGLFETAGFELSRVVPTGLDLCIIEGKPV
ncbi:MAG: methyltransferase [Methyloligellaceae bacterium]